MADRGRAYDVVTFDCYGTLIDWEAGIREAFESEAARLRRPVDSAAALALYIEIEAAVEAEPYRSYREVLAETARRIAARLGWPLPESRAGFLAESLPSWRPFADTNPALRRLVEADYQLGILSNVDDELLTWTRRHFAAFFEIAVTAEQVHSYKPAPGHFNAGRALVDGRRWLHAAQSYFHDVAPCRALGIPVAWINRKGEAAGTAKPDRELSTLGELAEWLAPAP
ncbi:MAG TPA: HAD family hydrolase [Candidatus Methylomirabilis sp.]|nr:HAD family hydrolase [Candidatus Methylomirabilis sp.]